MIESSHNFNAKAVLYADEGSIGAFFKKFAQAKLSDPDTREMLLEYFIDSIWLGPDGVTIASWFYENGDAMTWERLLATKEKAPHVLPFNGFDMRDVRYLHAYFDTNKFLGARAQFWVHPCM